MRELTKREEASRLVDPVELASWYCKKNLWWFVKEFWNVIVPNPLVWNWHMKVLCDEIQACDERVFLRQPKLYDLIINVPPGTSKTKIISIMSTAWEFARMPSIKVFVGSYSDAAVSGISDEIRIVMRSPKYQLYFPETIVRSDRDTMHNFKTEANGEFYAFTVGGSLTSKHADILKVDDPLNPKQAASEAELLTANNFFSKTLPTRKVDKAVTPTYLIMQRLAENDPSGFLLGRNKKGIRHICLPGSLSKDVKPAEYAKYYSNGLLDENRLNQAELDALRIELGTYGYSGQIDQRPTPEGGAIWQKWFIEVPDESWPDIDKGLSPGTDWDLAYTKNDTLAASAYVTSFELNGRVFLDDFNWQWLEFPEMINWMKGIRGPHYIEAKASGKSAKQVLTQNGITAIEVKVKGGLDKVSRAKMASPIAEAGRVCIRKSMADRMYADSKQGILFFPKGQFADLADALAQCLQRRSTSGPKYLREDDEFEEERDLLDEL